MKVQKIVAVLCWCCLPALVQAQTLAHRPAEPSAASPQLASRVDSDARLALPLAAEGEYRWGESGEVINLYVEGGELRGYMTRRSERKDAGSAPMTFAFAKAQISGKTFSFTTRAIHGDWYAFEGSVIKVTSQKRRGEDDYLLRGTLTTHLGPTDTGDLDDSSASDQRFTRQLSIRQSATRSKP